MVVRVYHSDGVDIHTNNTNSMIVLQYALLTCMLVTPLVFIFKRLCWFRRSRISVSPDTSVLLVLDPLEVYRYTFDPCHIKRLVHLVDKAKARGIPVVATKWIRTRGFVPDIFDEIGSWTEFVTSHSEAFLSELSHVEWDLVLDTVYSDAFAPSFVHGVKTPNVLYEFLEKNEKRNTIVCTGTWAEACIRNTAYTAAVHGLTPVVVASATGGHMGARLHALLTMDSTFSHVVDELSLE